MVIWCLILNWLDFLYFWFVVNNWIDWFLTFYLLRDLGCKNTLFRWRCLRCDDKTSTSLTNCIYVTLTMRLRMLLLAKLFFAFTFSLWCITLFSTRCFLTLLFKMSFDLRMDVLFNCFLKILFDYNFLGFIIIIINILLNWSQFVA